MYFQKDHMIRSLMGEILRNPINYKTLHDWSNARGGGGGGGGGGGDNAWN